MLILVSAFSLIAIVRELDSVGKGTYNAASEVAYVPLPTLSSSRTSAIRLNPEARITMISA